VLGRIEAQDEARGRLAHAGEGPVDPGAEQIHGQAMQADSSDHLAIGGRRSGRETDGVQVGAGGQVELAVEPVERLLEPGR
jgi:hypothetical protein